MLRFVALVGCAVLLALPACGARTGLDLGARRAADAGRLDAARPVDAAVALDARPADAGPRCEVTDWPLRVARETSLDRVGRTAEPMPDGAPDGVFDTTIPGPVSALVLVTVDASGRACCGQVWDTLAGATPIPASIGTSFSIGAQTWVLGVDVDGRPANAPDGSLVPIGEGCHTLRLFAADSGFFNPGQPYRLFLVGADGVARGGAVSTF
jgi:hypothetical protein